MNENKKIAVNSIILFVRLCLVSVINLVMARLVLQALGVSNYGLYNVVGGIVALLNVVNTAMVTTTYRYIAFELGKGEKGNTNKVFNSSLAIHVMFGLFILLVGLPIGEWYVSSFLNVAIESIGDAHFVLRISILTTMVSTILVPYQGLLVAFEKFYVSAVIDIITQCLKLVAVFALLYIVGNKIRIYSVIMFGYIFVSSIMFLIYSYRNHYSTCKLNFNKDWKLYREMFSFSGWILFGAISSVGKTQGGAMIINYFFGTLVNAAFAVANQMENFILMFSRMLSQAAVPQITKSFSSGNESRSVKLASYISKYTYILMLFVAFPIIMEMDFILGIWLKNVPAYTIPFVRLILVWSLIETINGPLYMAIQSTGKIKLYQLIVGIINLSNIPLLIFSFSVGAGPLWLMYIKISLNLFALVFRIYLCYKLVDFPVKRFILNSLLRPVLVVVLSVLCLFCCKQLLIIFHGFSFVFVTTIACLFFTSILVLLLGITKTEFNVFKSYIFRNRKVCEKK